MLTSSGAASIAWAPLRPLLGGWRDRPGLAWGPARRALPRTGPAGDRDGAAASRCRPGTSPKQAGTFTVALGRSRTFHGGEVTPLFFIGATLAALAPLAEAPSTCWRRSDRSQVRGRGHTPLARTLMAVGYFGAALAMLAAIAPAPRAVLRGRQASTRRSGLAQARQLAPRSRKADQRMADTVRAGTGSSRRQRAHFAVKTVGPAARCCRPPSATIAARQPSRPAGSARAGRLPCPVTSTRLPLRATRSSRRSRQTAPTRRPCRPATPPVAADRGCSGA